MAFVEVRTLIAGACTHPEWVVLKGGRFKNIRFPSSVGVIRHPTEGIILFDTGYTERFYQETKRLPQKLYALITPTSIETRDTAFMQLLRLGIRSKEVKHVIISHFHADHVAGLKDFKNAKYIYLDTCFDAVKNLSGLRAVKNAYLPGLLPKDFEKRSATLPEKEFEVSEWEFQTLDLFGDKSLYAVSLPGHTAGQIGLLCKTKQGDVFFVADACWQEKTYKQQVLPHPITNLLNHNKRAYRQTISQLHDFSTKNPNTTIVPCHCETALNRFDERHGQHGFF